MSEAVKLNFTFTIDEANTILQGLGNLPYGQVTALVDSIKTQAQMQLAEQQKQEASE